MSDRIKSISRRKFLGQASCAAIGSTTFFSSLVSLKALAAAAIDSSSVSAAGDYKALVCLFQAGGNDSFNMLMPRSGADYAGYAEIRSNLAIPAGEIRPINPVNSDGREFGVHPSMERVQQLFNDRKLAFLTNTGTLLRPTSRDDYYNYMNLPLGLYSHADQIQQWQTGLPHVRSNIGWGGKVADLISDMNSNDEISMNVSLSGTNVFQAGNNTVEYVIDPYSGSVGIYGHGPTDEWDVLNRVRTETIDSMIDHEYLNMFQQSYVDVIRRSRDSHAQFQEALESGPDLQTPFSDNYISESFRMIARTMAVREALGMKRQIFFVNYGGWDHHDEVLNNQIDMLGVVANAMGEFNDAVEELGLEDCVTTFSISEFGRTLTSNGNGTDHAWGGNVMVMGGHINGGDLYGNYPVLGTNGPRIVSDGVVIPEMSTDEYFAELALWFGVSPTDLGLLFPNLGNFYDVSSGQAPIGFLNI